MTRNMGYALLAGLAAIVVLVSTAIFIGVSGAKEDINAAPETGEAADPASDGTWVGTWSAAAAAAEPDTQDGLPNASIRNIAHSSVGGTRARIHLSNLYGNSPLTITHASLALAAAPSSPTAAAGSMRQLTFSDKPTVTIPPGGRVTSDAVRLNVPSAADILVTTYSPRGSGPVTYHPYARQTSYLAQGDRTTTADGAAFTRQIPYWRYLTGIDVWSTEAEGAVVVIGDSLTDGITSSPGANRRWTDFLAERLRTEPQAPRYSVLNSGISGNRVLVDGNKYYPNNGPSGLSRLKRDALSRTGAKAVIIQLGINDMLKSPRQSDPDRIVEGLRRMAQKARAQGLRVLGGTLTPFGGHRGYQPRLDAIRQAVNQQIRGGKVFDAVVDFDAALRDPAHPEQLRKAYDSGDHLHPNDNGFRAMAHAVDIRLLAETRPAKL